MLVVPLKHWLAVMKIYPNPMFLLGNHGFLGPQDKCIFQVTWRFHTLQYLQKLWRSVCSELVLMTCPEQKLESLNLPDKIHRRPAHIQHKLCLTGTFQEDIHQFCLLRNHLGPRNEIDCSICVTVMLNCSTIFNHHIVLFTSGRTLSLGFFLACCLFSQYLNQTDPNLYN